MLLNFRQSTCCHKQAKHSVEFQFTAVDLERKRQSAVVLTSFSQTPRDVERSSPSFTVSYSDTKEDSELEKLKYEKHRFARVDVAPSSVTEIGQFHSCCSRESVTLCVRTADVREFDILQHVSRNQ